jgi:hypothetical protein
VLVAAVSVSAADVARAQNAAIVPKSPVHPQSVRDAARDKTPIYVRVINMSGERRQVFVGKLRVDLPMAQPVSLVWMPGDLMHVVSDTNSRVDERICVPRADSTNSVVVH